MSCSYGEQGALHPSPQESDWSSEDWDRTKAKRKKDTNLLMHWDSPKPQTDIDQKTAADGLSLSKLQIGQRDPTEEHVE